MLRNTSAAQLIRRFLVLFFLFLLVAGPRWFFSYMSEGDLHTATLSGSVMVAPEESRMGRGLLASLCTSGQFWTPDTRRLLLSGDLAEVPSGTTMHMPDWGTDPILSRVRIVEGRLRGRQVWACREQIALKHPWP